MDPGADTGGAPGSAFLDRASSDTAAVDTASVDTTAVDTASLDSAFFDTAALDNASRDRASSVREQFLGQLRLRALPPAVPPGFVDRRRLTERMNAHATHPVMLICAAPGYGKTLTAASWSHSVPGRVAWLTVDDTDNDVPAFWADILGSLTLAGAAPPSTLLSELAPAAGFGEQEVRQVAEGLATVPTLVTVVLDDFHRITDEGVLHSFGQLLQHQPPRIRLVLITRTDPVLPLHRLRVNGQVTDIRAADLAFTASEAAELFDINGVLLSPTQLDVLSDRTKGWAAGLRLALMAMDPTDIDGTVHRFSGSTPLVAEYLLEQVMNQLTVPDREFLLTISVLDRVSGPLADRLTGHDDGQRILERLAAQHALVAGLAGGNDWFAIHPLLREMLLHRLAAEHPKAIGELHLRASRWFTSEGDLILAIKHASNAAAWSDVGRLTALALPLMVTTRAGALVAALGAASSRAHVEPSTGTLLASAFAHYHRHDYASMIQDAHDATELMGAEPGDHRTMAEAVIADLTMIGTRFRDPAGTGAAARHLLDVVDRIPRRDLPAADQYRVIALNNLGVWQVWSGDLAEAEQTLCWVLARSVEMDLGLIELGARAHLAVLDVIHGRLTAADRGIDVATKMMRRKGWASEPQTLGLHAAAALRHLERDELDAAQEQIAAGQAIGNSGSDVACELLLAIAGVGVATARDSADQVIEALLRCDRIRQRAGVLPPLLARWCTAARAEAHLAVGDPSVAMRLIDDSSDPRSYSAILQRIVLAKAHLMSHRPDLARGVLDPYLGSTAPYIGALIEAKVLAAVAADVNRRDTAAMTAIGEAIELAQHEGVIRPFRVMQPRLRALLSRYRHVVARHPDFTATLTDETDGGPPARNTPVGAQPLTEREQVVLGYLPTMLKSSEIASDLFITVNTVKSHQQSLYRKLGVTNRRQAVDRARELHLL